MSDKPAPPSPALLRDPGHLLSLGFGTGLSPKAPGTVGTLVGVALWWPLAHLPLVGYLLAVVAITLVGVWLCGRTGRVLGVHDHPAIVWDEVAGYLVAMAALPLGWEWALAGFIAFRFFDIVKPPPVGWIDRNLPGGWGVMLDDIAAGLMALGVLHLAHWALTLV